jgi:hypothetical protein
LSWEKFEVHESWADPDLPWNAKLRRAGRHIAEVRRLITALERDRPWTVERERGDLPNEVAFRLRIRQQVPADLSTAVGDVIHNLRSALDAVAYELARCHVGGALSEAEERATQFPIKKTRAEFDNFFKNSKREDLYGKQERAALRCVQPFAPVEEAAEHGAQLISSPDFDLKIHNLYRLHSLSVIDKHRRLPVLSWFPSLAYWSPPAVGASYRWRPAVPAESRFDDGALLGYLSDPAGDAPPRVDVFHEIRLVLSDDAPNGTDLVTTLDRWYGYLGGWVVPRVFYVAMGHPPPMIIGGF